MDFFAVAISAIFGAIGGLVGAYFRQKIQNRVLQLVAVAVSIVVFVQLGGLIYPYLRPTSKFDRLVRNSPGEYQSHPALIKALQGMSRAEAQAFTQEKARLGLRRLSFEELKAWNDLRLKLAMISPALCAGLWTGKGLANETVQKAVAELPETEGHKWIELSLKAAILEIENQSAPEVDMEAMQTTIQKISEGLSREDRQRFSAVLISGVNANDDDACWAMQKLLETAQSIPDPEQEPYLRALATL